MVWVGPNVNLNFEDPLQSAEIFDQLDGTIFSISTCPLPITHNGFRDGVANLNFNVETFPIDINFFFKLSALHRADFLKIEELAYLVSRFVQKYLLTWWVTLRQVCIILLEQFKNFKCYFLYFLTAIDMLKHIAKEKGL